MVSLYNEAGEYGATLRKYMAHPELIDKKKEEAAKTAAKEVQQEAVIDKLRGKDNHQLSAGLQSGEIDVEDLDEMADFAFTPDNEEDDEEAKSQKEENKKAAKEAKIAKQKHEKATKLKKHADEIINELPDGKADENMKASLRNSMYSAIDTAEVRAASVDEMTIDTTEIPFEEIEKMSQEKYAEMQKLQEEVSAAAFTRYNKDEVGAEDIPEEKGLAEADKSAQKAAEATKTTGHDPVAANTVPFNFSDKDSSKEKDKKSTNEEKSTDKKDKTVDTDTSIASSSTDSTNNPTTTVVNSDQTIRGEISTVNRQESSIEDNNWRTTTMRNPYGRTKGTYHDDILKDKDSAAYKRSKAIYEYLEEQGAWDRVDAVDDNLKLHEGDKVHIMVKFLPEVYGENTPFSSIPDEQKPYALALIMLDDKGNVLGDLPLAQWERNYYDSKKSEGLKNLIAFQNEAFKLFENNYAKTGNKEVILDDFKKEGVDTLGVKRINGNPSTLSIKKMYNGLVPTSQEYNTINEIIAGNGVQLGVITNEGVATGYNYKEHKHITLIPGEQVNVPQAKTGRPVMLLNSPSEKQVAIPIVTDTFVADKDSLIYRVLHTALVEALKYNENADISKQTFFQVCDLLSGLLQVDRFKNNKERGLFKKSNGKNTITVNLHKAGVDNPSKENGTDYSFTIDSVKGVSLDTLADMILEGLAEKHIPIQISTHYINKKIPLVTVKNGKVETEEIEYNKIIGELAKSPLPKGTTQVINNWFTLEYNPNSSTERQKMSPKADCIQTITINNAPYTLNFNSHTIKNKGDNPVEFKGHGDLYKSYARAFAERAEYKNKEVVYVVINGENYYYSKAEDKFVQRPGTETKVENTVTSDKEKEVNKEKSTEDSNNEKEKANNDKLEKKEAKTSPTKLTIEDVEKEVSSFLEKRYKKIWDKIPDELKVKLANGESSIQLSSAKTETYVINSITKKEINDVLSNFVKVKKFTVKEVPNNVKPMTKQTKSLEREKERRARHWLSKNLPSLSAKERTQFVGKLARGNSNMWATYKAGVIEVLKKAPRGAAYHEAFHYVMDMLLTQEEKENIFNIAGKEYGLLDKWEIEERLANDFRKYVIDSEDTGIVGTIKKWLRKLMDRINRYNRISDTTVNQLFWEINNGHFAKLSTAIEEEKENKEVVLREIRNVQNKRYQWDNLNNTIKENIKESGLSKEAYDNMSLEEKEQYVKCRG
jgi:hypothetical protein